MSALTDHRRLEYGFGHTPVRELRANVPESGTIYLRRIPAALPAVADALGELGHTVVVLAPTGAAPFLLPRPIVWHSPTGFEWGYWGSGPADLAANLLAYFTKDIREAWRLHQRFKQTVIGGIDRETGGTIPFGLVIGWLRSTWQIERADSVLMRLEEEDRTAEAAYRAAEEEEERAEPAPEEEEQAPTTFVCPYCLLPSTDREGHSVCLTRHLEHDAAMQQELYPDGTPRPARPAPLTTDAPLSKIEQGRAVYGA